jgi:hypothetical protein
MLFEQIDQTVVQAGARIALHEIETEPRQLSP